MADLGKKQLQQAWASQRYSELQAVASLLADRVSFQQFTTQALAENKLVQQFLQSPTDTQKQKLLKLWKKLINNTPTLNGISLINRQGEEVISTFNPDIKSNTKLPIDLNNLQSLQQQIIALHIFHDHGKTDSCIINISKLAPSTPNYQTELIVTHHTLSEMFTSITPNLGTGKLPFILVNQQGQVKSLGPIASHAQSPYTIDELISQQQPKLWQQMQTGHFGQFQDDQSMFVFLKIRLTTSQEQNNEYYLVSYIANDQIGQHFAIWYKLFFAVAIVFTLLAIIGIIFGHFYQLERRARQTSIELTDGLFNTDSGWIITDTYGRIIKANAAANASINHKLELEDRNLKRVLQLADNKYQDIYSLINATGFWQGEIQLNDNLDSVIRCRIQKVQLCKQHQQYWLVNIDNIAELTQAHIEAFEYKLLVDNATACALVDPNGQLIKYNPAFISLMQLEPLDSVNLGNLLDQTSQQWLRIYQQLEIHGHWQGSVNIHQNKEQYQARFKTLIDSDGELQYITCHFSTKPKEKLALYHELISNESLPNSNINEVQQGYSKLTSSVKQDLVLIMIDITPEHLLNLMRGISELAQYQELAKNCLIEHLPSGYQLFPWKLDKLLIFMPNTSTLAAHKFAEECMTLLSPLKLEKGGYLGIAKNNDMLSLEQLITDAETALKRAKQNCEQNICQAFTRTV